MLLHDWRPESGDGSRLEDVTAGVHGTVVGTIPTRDVPNKTWDYNGNGGFTIPALSVPQEVSFAAVIRIPTIPFPSTTIYFGGENTSEVPAFIGFSGSSQPMCRWGYTSADLDIEQATAPGAGIISGTWLSVIMTRSKRDGFRCNINGVHYAWLAARSVFPPALVKNYNIGHAAGALFGIFRMGRLQMLDALSPHSMLDKHEELKALYPLSDSLLEPFVR